MTSLLRLWTPAGSSGPVNSIRGGCLKNCIARNLESIPDYIFDRNTFDDGLCYSLIFFILDLLSVASQIFIFLIHPNMKFLVMQR
jgi:hypothetical protein